MMNMPPLAFKLALRLAPPADRDRRGGFQLEVELRPVPGAGRNGLVKTLCYSSSTALSPTPLSRLLERDRALCLGGTFPN